MREIRVKVSDETYNEFKAWLESRNEGQPKDEHLTMNYILKVFCEDLTGTPGWGSDERDYADQWFDRHGWYSNMW